MAAISASMNPRPRCRQRGEFFSSIRTKSRLNRGSSHSRYIPLPSSATPAALTPPCVKASVPSRQVPGHCDCASLLRLVQSPDPCLTDQACGIDTKSPGYASTGIGSCLLAFATRRALPSDGKRLSIYRFRCHHHVLTEMWAWQLRTYDCKK